MDIATAAGMDYELWRSMCASIRPRVLVLEEWNVERLRLYRLAKRCWDDEYFGDGTDVDNGFIEEGVSHSLTHYGNPYLSASG